MFLHNFCGQFHQTPWSRSACRVKRQCAASFPNPSRTVRCGMPMLRGPHLSTAPTTPPKPMRTPRPSVRPTLRDVKTFLKVAPIEDVCMMMYVVLKAWKLETHRITSARATPALEECRLRRRRVTNGTLLWQFVGLRSATKLQIVAHDSLQDNYQFMVLYMTIRWATIIIFDLEQSTSSSSKLILSNRIDFKEPTHT